MRAQQEVGRESRSPPSLKPPKGAPLKNNSPIRIGGGFKGQQRGFSPNQTTKKKRAKNFKNASPRLNPFLFIQAPPFPPSSWGAFDYLWVL